MTGTSRPEPRIRFDREKFIEAVHEIIARCSGEPERLGVERLHRALYYADMLAYLDRSEPVTGVEYIRETFGPAARYLDWAVNELQTRNLVIATPTTYYGIPKTNFALAQLDRQPTNRLSSYERELIHVVVEWVCGFDAKDISEIDARKPWLGVEVGESIPYGGALLLLPERRPTKHDVERADRKMSSAA